MFSYVIYSLVLTHNIWLSYHHHFYPQNAICILQSVSEITIKAEFAEDGTFFANIFPSLGIFAIKKVENRNK